MTFYEKLQKLMNKNNVRPVDVAKATGIATSSLSDWKAGRSKPKLDKLQILSDYFGVPVSYFTDEKQETNNTENKKTPKELKRLLESEEVTLNGRLLSETDKDKMLKIVEAAFWEAKEMNKRKK